MGVWTRKMERIPDRSSGINGSEAVVIDGAMGGGSGRPAGEVAKMCLPESVKLPEARGQPQANLFSHERNP